MADVPNFVESPRCVVTQISTANTARDGTGAIANVFTAGTNGSRIDLIVVQATGTTTNGMIRFFIHDGTSSSLFDEIAVRAVTPSGTVPAFSFSVGEKGEINNSKYPIILPMGYSLRASTNNAETFNVIVFGGDF